MTPDQTIDYHLRAIDKMVSKMEAEIDRLHSELAYMVDANAILNRWYDEDQETKRIQFKDIVKLTNLLAHVSSELNDPMEDRWCDRPIKDRSLLESLRDYVDQEMGW